MARVTSGHLCTMSGSLIRSPMRQTPDSPGRLAVTLRVFSSPVLSKGGWFKADSARELLWTEFACVECWVNLRFVRRGGLVRVNI